MNNLRRRMRTPHISSVVSIRAAKACETAAKYAGQFRRLISRRRDDRSNKFERSSRESSDNQSEISQLWYDQLLARGTLPAALSRMCMHALSYGFRVELLISSGNEFHAAIKLVTSSYRIASSRRRRWTHGLMHPF